jgi:tetratricopeptide (TPR) repeat protein
MRRLRVQFTLRWMMRGIAVSAVVLALLVTAHRQLKKTLADVGQLIRLNPNANDYCDRAAAWFAMKEYGKAIAGYNEAIRLAPDSPYAFHGRAGVWLERKDYHKAIADYSDAISRYSAIVHAFHDLSGSMDDSIQPWVSLLAHAYHGRGNAWLAKQEYDKSLADYGEAIRLNPQLPTTYDCRAAVWQLKGEYDKALADYGEAIRIDDGMVSAYESRAWIWASCPDAKLRDKKRPSTRQRTRAS